MKEADKKEWQPPGKLENDYDGEWQETRRRRKNENHRGTWRWYGE